MAGQSTRLHVSGYRFLLRRMEHALVRGDVRMLDDPLRAQSLSLTAGVVVAAVIVAGCAILAFLRPPGTLGGAPIVMARESGALYVRIGDVVHPVLNLASARLIAGSPANPEAVSAAAIANAKRGPLVGIAGAPSTISAPLGGAESGWAVCDGPTGTTVVAGDVPSGEPAGSRGVLATPDSEMAATTYLMYDGWRAKVDLRNRAVVRALKLDGISPRPLSRALLDAVPEAPPIVAPQIPAAGSPGPLRGIPVGSVVRVQRSTAEEFYVVLAQGVQRIGEVAADLIRFTNSQHIGVDTVSPDDVAAAPILDTLPVSSFPQRAGVSNDAVVCAHWRFSPAGADTAVTTVDSLGLNVTGPVSLAQADGDGPNVDAFSIPRGRSVYLRSTAIAGGDASAGALYFVDDSGVLYGLRDEDTAKYLGLTGTPTPAPWPVLAHLPRGPELSKEAASIARDSVAGPS